MALMEARRPGWRFEFNELVRFVLIIVGIAVVLWLGYVALFVAMGTITDERTSGISIDAEALDVGPGTSAGALTNLIRSDPGIVGWSDDVDTYQVRISLTSEGADASCFEVLAGDDLYVAAVRPDASGVIGISRSLGDGLWEAVHRQGAGPCI